MWDVLLARLCEVSQRNDLTGATRESLASHLKVSQPRVSTLMKRLRRERMVRDRKVRIEGIGRIQTVFQPSVEGRRRGASILARLESTRRASDRVKTEELLEEQADG